jgi:hypothetical protein
MPASPKPSPTSPSAARKQRACRGLLQQPARGRNIGHQIGREQRAEFRIAVREFADGEEGKVERAGLQLLQHLRFRAELARGQHAERHRALRALREARGKGCGGFAPLMRGRRDQPDPQRGALREGGARQHQPGGGEEGSAIHGVSP